MNINLDTLEPMGLPMFIDRSTEILAWLKGKSKDELKELWKCNDKIVEQNVRRLENMDLYHRLTPAILSYEGVAYQYMAPTVFEDGHFEYIQEHLSDEDLNVDKLAAVACVSVSSLFKKMKATIGISPNEFITISRLKKAVELLKDDSLSIEQISIMVGFRSHAYFSTCFKKQFGVSPTKYRETDEKNN